MVTTAGFVSAIISIETFTKSVLIKLFFDKKLKDANENQAADGSNCYKKYCAVDV